VLYAGGAVLRALSPRALEDWRALGETRFFPAAVAAGEIVETDERELTPEIRAALDGDWAGLLEHGRVPFVSYPFEWSFSMLQDAALLQLDLLRKALEEGLILKDATPYNVQWRGARPVFIDVGSFEPLREGEAWAGYRQFCQLFLFPLLLEAYKGLPFRPWLRGRLDGISPEEARRVMSFRDLFRRGVLTHVVLHARLEARYAERAERVRTDLRAAGFRAELVQANVRRLEKLVRRLERRAGRSEWSDYGARTSYDEQDAERKEAFVRKVVRSRRRGLVWDVGCNDGRFSRVAAEGADHVVALDADALVVDRLYRDLRSETDARIQPLVADVADPPPGLGWRGEERKRLEERGRPDLTLCLALVHHLAIARNIPLGQLVDWLRGLGGAVVVEFVDPEDAQARRLLAAKREGLHGDYTRERFEALLRAAFDVERAEPLGSGTRVLYLARPRA
jgi:SAM-dependent methyltransferase